MAHCLKTKEYFARKSCKCFSHSRHSKQRCLQFLHHGDNLVFVMQSNVELLEMIFAGKSLTRIILNDDQDALNKVRAAGLPCFLMDPCLEGFR
jgi:hypothetical protein